MKAALIQINSSQERNLAIVFKIAKTLFSLSAVVTLSLSLQGCSAVESVFDGSAFSDSTAQPTPEVPSEEKGAEVATENGKGIKDLRGNTQATVKPLSQTQRPAPSTQTKVESVPAKTIEIMWQVPTEPVEAYHIYLSSGAMDPKDEKRHFRVLVSSLKKEDDPSYGPVYKYQVPGNLTANTIEIRAENRFGLSEPSEPMIVQK